MAILSHEELNALGLTTLAGLSTTIGAAFAVSQACIASMRWARSKGGGAGRRGRPVAARRPPRPRPVPAAVHTHAARLLSPPLVY